MRRLHQHSGASKQRVQRRHTRTSSSACLRRTSPAARLSHRVRRCTIQLQADESTGLAFDALAMALASFLGSFFGATADATGESETGAVLWVRLRRRTHFAGRLEEASEGDIIPRDERQIGAKQCCACVSGSLRFFFDPLVVVAVAISSNSSKAVVHAGRLPAVPCIEQRMELLL